MTDERPPEGAPESNTETPETAPAADEPTSPAMPAYTPPSYTPPPVPPPAMPQPAMAQPAVAWAAPPASAPTKGRRTTLSLAAGILLVILGVLGVLASLAALTIGREVIRQFDFSTIPGMEQVENPTAFVESILTFGAIFLLVCSSFYVIGGVGVMRSANWGRIIGIVIGILASLVWLASFANTGHVSAASGRESGGAFALILLVIHLYVAIVLLFFWRTKASTA